ncbi:MAG TPA: hypothetical protein VF324_05980, partial [Methanobacterium sp.]
IVNFFLFHNTEHLFFYLSIDVAFVPIEVLIVVLVIEGVISAREKNILLEKLNMVIGVFFSEVGTDLLKTVSEFDSKSEKIRNNLIVKSNWSEKEFLDAGERIKNFKYDLEITGDAKSIEFLKCSKEFLMDKRKFLLVLLENPNLLEHETFTDLLRAVFHLTEELEKRGELNHLSRADYAHLKVDTQRAYGLLIYEWLQYMEHLMDNYPYLFSLALRINPFDPNATVEFKD